MGNITSEAIDDDLDRQGLVSVFMEVCKSGLSIQCEVWL